MTKQVDASTVTAVQLVSSNRFIVPDFQREYSWEVDLQVSEFWKDLHGSIGSGDYFLGLLIFTDGNRAKEVVDGQQRLITLTILANALRLAALRERRKLVADSVRSTFLYSVDYKTEDESLRITPNDPQDRADLEFLLSAESEDQIPQDRTSNIFGAHYSIVRSLRQDLDAADSSAVRLGQWAEFISQSLTFAIFVHPDRAAAFRVYEVINTRGKDLTPSELIKSYLIGSSEDATQDETHERWKAIEAQFEEISASNQVTTFIRHVVTLRVGYVTPRELYRIVTIEYQGSSGVQGLLDDLEAHLPVYVQMIDPSADIDSSDVTTKTFAVLQALSAGRFRPIFMEAVRHPDSDSLLQQLLAIVAPGVLAGRFGTGSIEAQFARAARRIHRDQDWKTELAKLAELRPERQDFAGRISRRLSRDHGHVVRAAILQGTILPSLDGYLHQVRPGEATDWPAFDDEDYKELGASIGNSVLLKISRRPQGSRSPQTVRIRMIPEKLEIESVEPESINDWSANYVRSENERLATQATELWYGPQ